MIKVLVGKKGSGKTAKLVDDMNHEALNSEKRIICIVKGTRLDTQVKPQIRLIDMDDYPIKGYEEFLGFIAGICARDYDITDIFVDSIQKVIKLDDFSGFKEFLHRLEPFAIEQKINMTIILSADKKAIPEEVKKFCVDY